MSRQRIPSRLRVLEMRHPERQKAAIVARLTEQYDTTEAEILADVEQIGEELHRLGLVTYEQQRAHFADDLGITVEELDARVDEMLRVTQ